MNYVTSTPIPKNGQSLLYEATNACGMTQTTPVSITVYDLPTVTTTATSICPGTPIDPTGYAKGTYLLQYSGEPLFVFYNIA